MLAVRALMLCGAIAVPAAALTVTSTADSGYGTLRDAITRAAAGDTINFAPSVSEVVLTSGQLSIERNINIINTNPATVTVRRSGATGTAEFRILLVTNSAATLSRLTISNGKSNTNPDNYPTNGGGDICNTGLLTLTDCYGQW